MEGSASRAKAWTRLAFLFLPLAATALLASQANNTEQTAEAQRLFLEIERAARLPAGPQSTLLPHLYRDVCSRWDQSGFFAPLAWTGFSTSPEAGESVEDLASRLLQKGGWPWLAEAGRRRCHEMLMAHRDEVAPLAREDMKSESRERRQWSLRVTGELKLSSLYGDVVDAFRGPEADAAAYALRDLDDPRAIPILVQGSPTEPTQHFEILSRLQRDRPAHTLLLELLRSNNSTVRWQAAYALAESRDPALAAVVERLAEDPAADVRRQAGRMGSLFHETDYRKVHQALVGLLSDSDIGVRSDVAFAMAWRKDPACAPALLQLVGLEDELEPWRQSNIVQAIHTLTGNYFGLTPGTPSPLDVRRRAMADLAQWIAN